MRQFILAVLVAAVLAGCSGLAAQQESRLAATMHTVTAQGVSHRVGSITFEDSRYGLIIIPDLYNLPPGLLGTHVHQNPSCAPGLDGTPGGNAGSHYDPVESNMHLGPYGEGHLGDLPNLTVEQNGSASLPVLAPRVKISDLVGRSLILHAGKDDYDGHPGGGRLACGVIR